MNELSVCCKRDILYTEFGGWCPTYSSSLVLLPQAKVIISLANYIILWGLRVIFKEAHSGREHLLFTV